MPRGVKGSRKGAAGKGRKGSIGGIVAQVALFVATAVRFLSKLPPEAREMIFDQIESALRNVDAAKAPKQARRPRKPKDEPAAVAPPPAPPERRAPAKKKAAPKKKRPSRARTQPTETVEDTGEGIPGEGQ